MVMLFCGYLKNLRDSKTYRTKAYQQHLTQAKILVGNLVASYTYDENGLRITKTVGDTTYAYFYNNVGTRVKSGIFEYVLDREGY